MPPLPFRDHATINPLAMITITDVTIESGATSCVTSDTAAANAHTMVTVNAINVMRASLLTVHSLQRHIPPSINNRKGGG